MLSWNEIRHRAIAFSREWKDTTSEQAEKQSYWNDFFHIFGIKRKAVATFEEPVKKLTGSWGFIDLFWPGRVLIEHKSAGQDLGKAHTQAMDYIRGLVDTGRQNEAPRFLIVSDFKRIALHDLEPENDPDLPLFKRLPPSIEFPIEDLHKHIRRFAFIPGYKQHKLDPEDPANIEAATVMAHLHDALEKGGFSGHDLRVLLVRLLFCLFADDTGIFPQKSFHLYLENRTAADGSDTGPKLARLFDVLNTPIEKRQHNLDDDLKEFDYINGDLFAERISFADFDAQMRGQLLKACEFEWAKISPAIFGSLFQGVMDGKERRQIGAHYTSERDILKLIRPLFLDELRAEFQSAVKDKSGRGPGRLKTLQKKLATLRFLDPACGCGNFLVITYRELRALELEILHALHASAGLAGHQELGEQDVFNLSLVDVDQMYGIEIEEFPARIAEVALWLADHQANIALSESFGQLYRRIPLKKSPHIVNANALRTPWTSVIKPEECNYILGNPPFVGHQWRSPEQMADIAHIWGNEGRFGRLDLVTAWYRKAADFMTKETTAAFVSTNSISQGEQVAILWADLFSRGMEIKFAHRTFVWQSEARGKAHVHCVIIGFGHAWSPAIKQLFDYDNDPKGDKAEVRGCTNISPYLIEGPNLILPSRTDPRPGYPQMKKGSQPTDGGGLVITREVHDKILAEHPKVAQWLRPFIGGEELINGGSRWCLWLKDAAPQEIKKQPFLIERLEIVRAARIKSPTKSVRDFANYPSLFTQDRQPTDSYLAVPEVSSENRKFIPIGFLEPDIIGSNQLQMIVGGTLFHFGILSSTMHMSWVKSFAGRLESRYRYSPSVYNNFPWPEDATEAQRAKVEECAKAVLAAREEFPGSTLADLYDPLTMPPRLAKAHEALDRAVERAYRKEAFESDRQRVEYLFSLYEKLTAPLAVVKKPRKGK